MRGSTQYKEKRNKSYAVADIDRENRIPFTIARRDASKDKTMVESEDTFHGLRYISSFHHMLMKEQ